MGHTSGWLSVDGQHIFESYKYKGAFNLKEVLYL